MKRLKMPSAKGRFQEDESIRIIQNKIIGHPTQYTKNEKSCHFLSRPTLTAETFQFVSHFSKKIPEESYSIPGFISSQEKWISKLIKKISNHCKKGKIEELLN